VRAVTGIEALLDFGKLETETLRKGTLELHGHTRDCLEGVDALPIDALIHASSTRRTLDHPQQLGSRLFVETLH
jgi:hypothetical protein